MKAILLYQPLRFFLTGIIFLSFLAVSSAQTTLEHLEDQLANSFGKDKLIVLNELVAFHLSEDNDKEALRHARSAETLAEAIISSDNRLIPEEFYYLKPLAHLQLGQALQQNGKYLDSKKVYEKALIEAEQIENKSLVEQAQQAIQAIAALPNENSKEKKGFLGKALRDISSSIGKTSDDFGILANLKLAKMHENNENFEKAIKKYELVINQLRDQGDWEQVEELRAHLADIQEQEGNLAGALSTLTEIKKDKEEAYDNTGATIVQRKIDEVNVKMNTPKASLPSQPPKPIPTPAPPQVVVAEKELKDIKIIAERAENNQDYEASLNYYKQYLTLEQTLAEQEKLQELALLETAHQIERQEQEIMLLRQNEEISQLQLTQNQAELKRQLSAKRTITGGLALSGMLVLSLIMLYRNKQRDHQKLGVAFNDLEVTQQQLKKAEHRIKNLLNQQVSGAVANELLSSVNHQQVHRKFVCIMFLDIRDFTPYVEKLSPEEIIEYQNKVLGFMMEIVNKRKGIINQILGDGFMATFGAPVSAGNDCQEAYLAAEEIMSKVKEKSESGEIPPTKVGIGLHAGQVVAGNVGTKDRKQYSITGNPVIIAARLEQLNKKYGSTMILSKEVYDQLPEDIQKPIKFHEVKVKGRSKPVEVATL